MISRIHSKLGTAGFVVAIVALIAALSGAAIAAGGLTKSQEKQVKKIAKKFAGKDGAPGTPGAPGLPGAPGPKGDKGDKGDTGSEGPQGKQGTQGIQGPEGDPWTAGGVLPPGESMSGKWGYAGGAAGLFATSISFNLPYPDSAGPAFHFVKFTEAPTTDCPGTVGAPTAKPGHFCVYEITAVGGNPGTFESGMSNGVNNLDKFVNGATLFFSGGEFSFSGGTWAVTAPEAP